MSGMNRLVRRIVIIPISLLRTTVKAEEEEKTLNISAAKRAIAKHHIAEATTKWGILDRELSSDIAGETGAVYIYKGAQSALRLRGVENCPVNQFVDAHQSAEETHLLIMEQLVPDSEMHTSLLPVWRYAGFVLGFLPTLIAGPYGLFATVESVESFVVEHYTSQIEHLDHVAHRCPDETRELTRILNFCCDDERHHMLDARHRRLASNNHTSTVNADHECSSKNTASSFTFLSLWDFIVKSGSRLAAEVARRI